MLPELDPEELSRWLAEKLPGQSGLITTRIGGGQSNPTYFVDWGNVRLVLRKKPDGPILKGAHSVEREFRLLRSLAGSEFPIPIALWLEEDSSILGTPFYVMERLDGRVFDDARLPQLAPEERREIYLAMARTLAALHRVRPDDVGLGDFGRQKGYFERQLKQWSGQYEASLGGRLPALDRIIEWLACEMPEDNGLVCIAHGDYRLGNLMFHPTEPRVVAVLDWELATLGPPMADLGFCVMPWHTTPDEYGGIMGTGEAGEGIPSEDEFIEEYMANALPCGRLMPFHVAFALFRFAVIFVGISDRARAGTAASKDAEKLAPLAERFAVRALEAAGIASD